MVQVGDQQRSSDYTIKMIQKIHDGYIGDAYMAKAWYANTRGATHYGEPARRSATLNWDLWQGPAPRSEYRENIHPYNWHWLRRYGTGETLNNGTHEVDVCRWALGVEFPHAVTASGGNYQYKDDWQFYDTLITNFEYPDKLISWEGRSRQGMRLYDRDRGSVIMGTKGSVVIDRGGYDVYDWKGKQIDTLPHRPRRPQPTDLIGHDTMTDAHFANFIAAIHGQEEAPLAHPGRQCHRHHAAALEHRLVRQPHAAPRSGDRAHPQRCRSHEVLGPHLREGLGSDRLENR